MNETLSLNSGGTVSVARAETAAKGIVIYFHGGGFVYGSKNDLPQKLQNIFLDKGYTVLAIDYLLTPNTSLQDSLTQMQETLAELQEKEIKDLSFSFCGRSAGGFAMMYLTKQLLQQNKTLPEQLIHFYGYSDLAFINNPRELADMTVTQEMIASTELNQPVWDDPLLQRYLLYVYGVQQQKLADFYQVSKENSERFTIDKNTLQQFPRTFSSASTTDEEVPFKYSKQLKRLIPDCKFFPVYNLEHDFLKHPEDEQVEKVLNNLAEWLK
mgnify:FL=1